jgi:hydroxyacylglutathione hydrolase
MLVEQFLVEGPLANFNYLLACPETGEALAVDPLDATAVLARARERGWSIRQVVNTHQHWDHVGGNEEVKAATGARVWAHAGAKGHIPAMDGALHAGDVLRIGKTAELLVLDTPGHTSAHVCLRARGVGDALFSGDTLFNAGVGNCHGGGDPHTLYETFRDQVARLPDQTRVYPGHDYALRNLAFTLTVEPDNAAARELLSALEERGTQGFSSTMGLERQVNSFLRLASPGLHAALRERVPGLDFDSEQEVFVALRRLRDRW